MRMFRLVPAAAALGLAALAGAAWAQSGSYQASCRNVTSLGGGTISAECSDGRGRWRSSTIAAGQCQGDIGNNNGMLQCNGAAASGGAYVPDPPRRDDRNDNRGYGGGYNSGGYNNGGYGGRYDNGRYDNDRYDDRYNNGGGYGGRDRDRDERFQSRGAVVAGSYQSSCRYAETVQGGYLTAECMDHNRRYRQSTIQYTACRSDISNQNGMLACAGATATGGIYSRD